METGALNSVSEPPSFTNKRNSGLWERASGRPCLLPVGFILGLLHHAKNPHQGGKARQTAPVLCPGRVHSTQLHTEPGLPVLAQTVSYLFVREHTMKSL